MKYLACLILSAAAALGSNVGDTYQQVVAEKGVPKGEIAAGPMRVLTYSDVVIRLRDDVVVSIRAAPPEPTRAPIPKPTPAPPKTPKEAMAFLKEQLDTAVQEVQRIVNLPAPSQPQPPNMSIGSFFFPPGAPRPDFDHVDVRATRTTPYDSIPFITWDGHTELMWAGRDLEFNPMTEYFYQDRTLPKRKLTEAEMLEINRLYRVIGQCEKHLGELGYPGAVP